MSPSNLVAWSLLLIGVGLLLQQTIFYLLMRSKYTARLAGIERRRQDGCEKCPTNRSCTKYERKAGYVA